MRTTVNIDDSALALGKAHAAETGRSLGEVVSDALRSTLAGSKASEIADLPKLPSFGSGGPRPGVDLNDNAQIQDIVDGLE